MKNLFFTLLLSLVGLSAFGAEIQPKKHAILIGVDDYVQLAKLRFAKNDILALRDQLYKIGFDETNVYCLTCGGETKYLPTKENIQLYINTILESAKEGDTVLLAMSGHGIDEDQPRFCPMDAKEKDLLATTIPISDIFNSLEKCKATFKLMLVDACRETPFATKSVAQVSTLQTLANPPKGIVLFQSCGKGELSREDMEHQKGIFTHYLVEGLQGNAADKNGNVTLLGLTSYVASKTKRRALEQYQAKQTPYLKGEISDFILASGVSSSETRTKNTPQRQKIIEAMSTLPLVLGALADENGGDYQEVLAETEKIADDATLPRDFRNAYSQYLKNYKKMQGKPEGSPETTAMAMSYLKLGGVLRSYDIDIIQAMTGQLMEDSQKLLDDNQTSVETEDNPQTQEKKDDTESKPQKKPTRNFVPENSETAKLHNEILADMKNFREAKSKGEDLVYYFEQYENKAKMALWKKAAEKEIPEGMFLYAYHLKNYGNNYSKSLSFYQRAAESGLVDAQMKLGEYYYFGIESNIPKDMKASFQWYLMAAEQGNANAQYNVGFCYDVGSGIKADKVKAVTWYHKAASQGYEDARKRLQELGEQ
ncbi:MAG: caspase family protein [Planctomycetaceae bacterium]|nr:caspase family protein [Planctomycetaceae bacterium]